jgi:hypothetical protein
VRMLVVFATIYSCYSPDEADRGSRVRGSLWVLQRRGERACWVGLSSKVTYILTHVGARAVTKPVVGVFDLASNVSEGRLPFLLHNN